MSEKKSPLQFPCQFPIKAMGIANDEFKSATMDIFHRHFPRLKESSIKMTLSKEKKYLSITVTIRATSKKQLDTIYHDLSDEPTVLMSL